MPDIDRILAAICRTSKKQLVHQPERRLHFCLSIKQILQLVFDINQSMSHLTFNQLLQSICQVLSDQDLNDLHLSIQDIIDEDVCYGKGALPQHQRCYAVKSGIDSLLDVARKTLSEQTEDIVEYIGITRPILL